MANLPPLSSPAPNGSIALLTKKPVDKDARIRKIARVITTLIGVGLGAFLGAHYGSQTSLVGYDKIFHIINTAALGTTAGGLISLAPHLLGSPDRKFLGYGLPFFALSLFIGAIEYQIDSTLFYATPAALVAALLFTWAMNRTSEDQNEDLKN